MATLRALHDGETEFDQLMFARLAAEILYAAELPLGPDDIQEFQKGFQLIRSNTGDLSFASPRMLLYDQEPDESDRNFVLGMVMYYLFTESHEDLAMKAELPLFALYAEKEFNAYPLLGDSEYQGNIHHFDDENHMLSWAALLTSADPAEQRRGRQSVEQWLQGFGAKLTVQFYYHGRMLTEKTWAFNPETREPITLQSARTLSAANGQSFHPVRDYTARYMPGTQTIAVELEKL